MSSPDLWVIYFHSSFCPQIRALCSTSKPSIILQAGRDVHIMASLNNVASWLLVASLSRDTVFHLYAATHCLPLIQTLTPHVWNDKFRHHTLSAWLCHLPAVLCFNTNKLFFRISKPQVHLLSPPLSRPYGFFTFWSRLVHHNDNAVNYIINFLFLVPFCLLTWQKPVCQTVQIAGNINSHQSQLGTRHSPEITCSFCG